jgi:uncharacterized membrane-anchored protein YhcB (DUF1043 family)
MCRMGKIPLVFGIVLGYNYSRLATKGVRRDLSVQDDFVEQSSTCSANSRKECKLCQK